MSRPLRIEYAGAFYHVTSRGNAKQAIYRQEEDFDLFLNVLSSVCQRYNWIIHTYCLMNNHYHLFIETPDGNLSKGMRQLNGVYTQKFNRIHKSVGHLFQGRYKAILVDKESYFLEVGRYILLNPVRAQMVKTPDEYIRSSWRSIMGEQDVPMWLAVDETLLRFGNQRKKAINKYREFVLEGIGKSLWNNVKQQIYLGSDPFVLKYLPNPALEIGDLAEVPAKQYRPKALSLEEYKQMHANRNDAIIAAFKSGGYTQKEIGDFFALHYSRVSRITAKGKT